MTELRAAIIRLFEQGNSGEKIGKMLEVPARTAVCRFRPCRFRPNFFGSFFLDLKWVSNAGKALARLIRDF